MKKLILLVAVLLTTPALADVRLPKIVGSGMVLQRDCDVKLWGWADDGEQVTVTCDWLDAPVTAEADADGTWHVDVHTAKAGGPHTITVAGKNTIALNDVLFGEVWIGSGQSNMEMPLVEVSGAYTGIDNAAAEVAAADYPEIRLFQAGNFSSREPLDDVEPGIEMYGIPPAECRWQACTPETVPTFSSTAYLFARELHKALGVPVGIIDASWGGTPAEAWTPAAGLEALGMTAELDQAKNLPQKADEKIPTRLYNGMIHPLRNYRIKGVIWYQGEGNAGRADRYHALFSTMIRQWREVFGDDFSFYFVQIAPFGYRDVNAAYLREAQLDTLDVDHTGMAVTMDIGNIEDIHPKNKQEVGRRLALWALANDYGRDVVASGPLFKACTFADGKARITFDYADGGLTTRDGETPNNFEVAGGDRVFHAATATIEGDTLVVSSPEVSDPQAVRYAFTSDAMPNLANQAGLPASPFRTDEW
ncbi:MAG: sialate O-acetylesterase [Planctomycetales bacterium]|nr:sialate O-acetylesterase [Planctomycetales bacterium]